MSRRRLTRQRRVEWSISIVHAIAQCVTSGSSSVVSSGAFRDADNNVSNASKHVTVFNRIEVRKPLLRQRVKIISISACFSCICLLILFVCTLDVQDQ